MRTKLQRVLVTGGAGFIGSHSVDLLLAQGLKVTVLDNLSAGKKQNLPLSHPNLQFIRGDIRKPQTLKKALQNVSHVLHLAAQVSGSHSVIEPLTSFDANICGFNLLINQIREQKRKIRLVYASSAAVYGDPTKGPCHEHLATCAKTLSPYGLSKRYDEECAELFQRLYGIPTLGLRYFNVFGPRQDPDSPYSGVISKFSCSAFKNQRIIIYGDGKQTRDFIAVHDVARANYLALTTPYCGVVNIGTGKRTSILRLTQTIEKMSSTKFRCQFKKIRPGDIQHSLADTTMAQQELGFVAELSLQQGLREFFSRMVC